MPNQPSNLWQTPATLLRLIAGASTYTGWRLGLLFGRWPASSREGTRQPSHTRRELRPSAFARSGPKSRDQNRHARSKISERRGPNDGYAAVNVTVSTVGGSTMARKSSRPPQPNAAATRSMSTPGFGGVWPQRSTGTVGTHRRASRRAPDRRIRARLESVAGRVGSRADHPLRARDGCLLDEAARTSWFMGRLPCGLLASRQSRPGRQWRRRRRVVRGLSLHREWG